MNKKRTIALKDPLLIKIRNNIRDLIESAIITQKKEIRNKKTKIIGRSPEEQEKFRKLDKDWWDIENSLRASIIKCPACFSSKKDMTYNPNTKMWYCTSCYKIMQEYNDVEMDGEIVNFP